MRRPQARLSIILLSTVYPSWIPGQWCKSRCSFSTMASSDPSSLISLLRLLPHELQQDSRKAHNIIVADYVSFHASFVVCCHLPPQLVGPAESRRLTCSLLGCMCRTWHRVLACSCKKAFSRTDHLELPHRPRKTAVPVLSSSCSRAQAILLQA